MKVDKNPVIRSAPAPEVLMAEFARRSDPRAFEKLLSRYTPPALAVARQILLDNILAEDAVQETFLRVLRSRNRYNTAEPFSRWFYTILRNICIDMLRRRKRHLKAVNEIVDSFTSAPSKKTLPYDAREILRTLPASEQAVLTLRIVHDMPFHDIASAIGISTEAAKKRAQRGLKKLREKLNHSAEAAGERLNITSFTKKSLRNSIA